VLQEYDLFVDELLKEVAILLLFLYYLILMLLLLIQLEVFVLFDPLDAPILDFGLGRRITERILDCHRAQEVAVLYLIHIFGGLRDLKVWLLEDLVRLLGLILIFYANDLLVIEYSV
jgi:hypothetical protein